ncbi:MAG: ZIP family metal transporter, partial [bacterium]|nr:ZIP family metal transporter [bacterium]
ESIEIGEKFFDPSEITLWVAGGFLFYLVLDRVIFIHFSSHAAEDDADHAAHALPERGILGAASLSFHSFLDGLAIGLAFQVSSAIGLVVTIAVLTHDFSDGINTVSLILKNRGERKNALRWLFVDALAPVAGAASTLFFSLPEQVLAVMLAVFSGFFLYIGASDLIPESHHAHPKFLTTAMTLLGAGVLFVAIRFAHF